MRKYQGIFSGLGQGRAMVRFKELAICDVSEGDVTFAEVLGWIEQAYYHS